MRDGPTRSADHADRNLQQRVAEHERAEDLAHLNLGEAELAA